MDSDRLAGLTAELKGQLWLIEKVNNRLRSKINDGLDMPGQLDSVAYQIHNLYCSTEDLLKLVAKAFENNVDRLRGFWHVVRHAYGNEIELIQLQANIAAAQKLYDLVA